MTGARITIDVENEAVIAALNALTRRATDMTPAMREIGEVVTRQTKTRIEAGGPAPSARHPLGAALTGDDCTRGSAESG